MPSKVVVTAGSPEVMKDGELALDLTSTALRRVGFPVPVGSPVELVQKCVHNNGRKRFISPLRLQFTTQRNRGRNLMVGTISRDHERMLLTVLLLTACSGCFHTGSRTNSPQMALPIMRQIFQ